MKNILTDAIRANKRVGRGSCSSIDECYTDDELAKALVEAGVDTVKGAIRWALDGEALFREQGLNQRWGDDTDPQLASYKAWVNQDDDYEARAESLAAAREEEAAHGRGE